MSRAVCSFWVLTAVTVLATGLVSMSLSAPAGPGADVLLAFGAALLLVSGTLLYRVLRHLVRTTDRLEPLPPP